MLVFVHKTYLPVCKADITLIDNIEPTISVSKLKVQIAEKEGTPPVDQMLIFISGHGELCKIQILGVDDRPICEYGLQNRSRVFLEIIRPGVTKHDILMKYMQLGDQFKLIAATTSNTDFDPIVAGDFGMFNGETRHPGGMCSNTKCMFYDKVFICAKVNGRPVPTIEDVLTCSSCGTETIDVGMIMFKEAKLKFKKKLL